MARTTAQQKPLSRRILVVIDRDMTAKTPRVIWQHEKPVLEALLGEGKVVEVAPETLDEGYIDKPSPALLPYNKKQDRVPRPSESLGIGFVYIGDARAEYDRLANAYGKLPDENILAVEKVYGRAQDGKFSAIVGVPDLEDLPDAQLRQLIEAYGYAPQGAHKDMPDAEKQAAADALKAFREATREQLVKLAQEAGVQLG